MGGARPLRAPSAPLRGAPAEASASSDASGSDGPKGGGVEATWAAKGFLGAFWKFLRPHTIRGTVLGSTSLTLRVLMENPELVDLALVPRALLGVTALLCGNGFIVGVNQIYDVGIDRVNKPFLPVAAGELSGRAAWILCAVLATLGLFITAVNFGGMVTSLYTLGIVLGTVYSVPPFRLKRYAVPAFLIIATVRGFLLNFGVYHSVRAALRLPFQWSPHTAFITVFVTLFAVCIALTKDLPDVRGDRAANIRTFASVLGERRTTLLAAGLLLSNYVGAVALAALRPGVFNAPLMAAGHALLGASLVYNTWKLDRAQYTKTAITAFYRSVWTLFYSEYLLFPFI